ncbi:GNAT family N-acetyltransferase [Glycomyces harbinensis]|uniref:Acetyltransferase (GNAT) domain-containing protein n=1 Tax=Glycomyces harbinensis TaxID=58114 RepID=A0A1G6X8Z4_9ACTN|nr:GNAT family N-acetyltransferase [Glycomyces harbinensis]SDD74293.1 Acetyltransferase (GNAT) domain-containing protein [Glycomyces harbinensis]
MSTDNPAGHSIPDLVMAWGRGRAVSRVTPQPVPVPGGFAVPVGAPGTDLRQVFHTYTAASLAEAAERMAAPGHQIMIAGPTDDLRDAVPSTWTMDDAGHLMTTAFNPTAYAAPEGCRLNVETEGELTVARAFHFNGDLAASARLGRTGEIGVFDKVVTAPNHQRRGLGSTLMRALSTTAYHLGMRQGLLVGSDEGRALYEHLGWTYVSDFPGARSKSA